MTHPEATSADQADEQPPEAHNPDSTLMPAPDPGGWEAVVNQLEPTHRKTPKQDTAEAFAKALQEEQS